MSADHPTSLDDRVRAVIEFVIQELAADSAPTMQAQVSAATVTSASATMVDVEVPEGVPLLTIPDGPVPGAVVVLGPDGEPSGEVLVWVSNGKLTGVEHAWYTDDPPTSWPDVALLRRD